MLRMNDQKKRSILNWIRALRPVPLALTLVAAAFFFPGTAGQPAHIGALAVRARLEEGAREYLRRTAEILGDRYDGAFYPPAVEMLRDDFNAAIDSLSSRNGEFYSRFYMDGS